jgi:hypothetical protein
MTKLIILLLFTAVRSHCAQSMTVSPSCRRPHRPKIDVDCTRSTSRSFLKASPRGKPISFQTVGRQNTPGWPDRRLRRQATINGTEVPRGNLMSIQRLKLSSAASGSVRTVLHVEYSNLNPEGSRDPILAISERAPALLLWRKVVPPNGLYRDKADRTPSRRPPAGHCH